MFYLKKLITHVVLPPGVFILIFVISGIYLIRRRQRIGYFLIFSGICFYVLSIGPTKNVLVSYLEGDLPLSRNVRGDVIIILGGGGEIGYFDRLISGYNLYKQLKVPLLLTGRDNESDRAKTILMQMGLPEEDIIQELDSKDTYENSLYAKQIIEEKGFKSPILISSAYHLRRAIFLFERQGIRVVPVLCDLKTKQEKEYNMLSFLPKSNELDDSTKALKEYMGFIAAKMGIY